MEVEVIRAFLLESFERKWNGANNQQNRGSDTFWDFITKPRKVDVNFAILKVYLFRMSRLSTLSLIKYHPVFNSLIHSLSKFST